MDFDGSHPHAGTGALSSGQSQSRQDNIYDYKKIPITKKLKRYYRKIDFFAQPVTLKYKGERRFYTNFGALTSLVIILIMVALTIVQFTVMVSFSQISFQESAQLSVARDQLLGLDHGFLFAYRIINRITGGNFNTTGYLHSEIMQISQSWVGSDNDQKRDSSVRHIAMENCSKYFFKYHQDITKQTMNRIQLQNYSCPKNKTLSIRGDFIDDKFTYIKLGVRKCNPVTALQEGYRCKSDKEIDDMVGNLEVQFIFLNANFDQLDLIDPIKQVNIKISYHRIYIDDILRENILPGFMRKYDIFLRNNTASLSNDYLRVQAPINLQFFQVKSKESYIEQFNPVNQEYIAFYLRTSREQSVFTRNVYSVYDIFTEIGGIRNSLMFIGLIFCAAFEYNLFLSSLIRKLFHFPARFDKERKDLVQEKKKSKKSRSRSRSTSRRGSRRASTMHSKNSGNGGSGPSAINQSISSGTMALSNQRLLEENEDEEKKREQELGVKELKDEINLVIGRSKAADFKLKTTGLLKFFFCCLICRKNQSMRFSPSKRQALFFQKGEDRLNKELDISFIVHNIRRVNYLMKILLDKDQRRLLKLKQSEFIDSSCDEQHDPTIYKKGVKKDKLLNLYVDNLRIKKLKRSDVKLLEIMGFNKVLDILNKQRSLDKIQNDWGHEDLTVQDSTPLHTQELLSKPTFTQENFASSNTTPLPHNIHFKTSNLIRAPYMTDKRNDVLQGKFQERRGVREKEKLSEVPFKSFERSDDDLGAIGNNRTFGLVGTLTGTLGNGNTTGKRKDRSRARQLNTNHNSGGDKNLLLDESSSPDATLNKVTLKFSKNTSQQQSQQIFSINHQRKESFSPVRVHDANIDQIPQEHISKTKRKKRVDDEKQRESSSSPTKSRDKVRSGQRNVKQYSSKQYRKESSRALLGNQGNFEDTLNQNKVKDNSPNR